MATTAVGDRYVLDELRRRGWALGGEQSGHIIDLGFGPSGDGIASALLTLEALGERDLSQRDGMEKLPQRLVNIRAVDRTAVNAALEHPLVREAIERESDALSGRGRVLVRASGTEPLIRVMVEAPGQDETDAVCARLQEAVEKALGVAARTAATRGRGWQPGRARTAAMQGPPTQPLTSGFRSAVPQNADRRCGSTP